MNTPMIWLPGAPEAPARESRVEIRRSFSIRVNAELHGGAKYESAEFFQSMNTWSTQETAAAVSDVLHAACKRAVLKAANEHIQDLRSGAWAHQLDPHPVARENAAAFEKWNNNRAPSAKTA